MKWTPRWLLSARGITNRSNSANHLFSKSQPLSCLATFLGTDSLSVLICRKAVNQSINQLKIRPSLADTACIWNFNVRQIFLHIIRSRVLLQTASDSNNGMWNRWHLFSTLGTRHWTRCAHIAAGLCKYDGETLQNDIGFLSMYATPVWRVTWTCDAPKCVDCVSRPYLQL